MEWLVTYDIDTHDRAGERRLARVAKVCEGYGLRIQHSVFECRLSLAALESFVQDLDLTIDHDLDSVNIYQFPGEITAARRTLGRPLGTTTDKPWIV